MPIWGYFVIGFLIVVLVLLTARRNQVAYHQQPLDYGADFRAVLEDASKHIRPWIPVVSLSKGFEQGSLLRMTEVIKEGGFSSVRRATETPFNLILEARP